MEDFNFRCSKDITRLGFRILGTFYEANGTDYNLKLPTGWPSIDAVTCGGYWSSDLIVLTGAAGSGKATFFLNSAVNIAKTAEPVAILSLKTTIEKLSLKMISSESEITIDMITKGAVPIKGWYKITMAITRLVDLPLFVFDATFETIDDVIAEIKTAKKLIPGLRCFMLEGVDTLTTVKDELAECLRRLKIIAKKLELTIFVTTTATGDIEIDSLAKYADFVMLLSFKEKAHKTNTTFFEPEDFEEGHYQVQKTVISRYNAEIVVRKNKHGPKTSLCFFFIPAKAQFMDIGPKIADFSLWNYNFTIKQ